MNNKQQNSEKELGWDDEITKESEYILLPEGTYHFIVTAFVNHRDGATGLYT